MKKTSLVAAAICLLMLAPAGCAQDKSPDTDSGGASAAVVVEGTEGTTPEQALPFGGAYVFPDDIEVLIGEPSSVTLSGFAADDYDLSLGDPTGLSVTFVNRGTEDITSQGVFVEMLSGGEVSQLVLDTQSKRAIHSGLQGAYTEEQLLEMPPVLLRPGKPYTFQLVFIAADPEDMLLSMSDVESRTLYFTNR